MAQSKDEVLRSIKVNKAKALSVKNMKEAIINLSKSPEDFYNIFEIRFKRGNTCVKNVKRRPFVSKTALYGCLYLQIALYSIS